METATDLLSCTGVRRQLRGVLVVGGNATQSGPGRVHPAGQPPSVSQW